jgi:hypothetical protein
VRTSADGWCVAHSHAQTPGPVVRCDHPTQFDLVQTRRDLCPCDRTQSVRVTTWRHLPVTASGMSNGV